MTVSVIIPNYNHAIFLKQRIESILVQTYRNFELIILDDCSTDDSREIIEHYRNHPKVIQIVLNSQNSGSVFKQWEKGIHLAGGELVWIAESDDYADSQFLEKMVPVLQVDVSIGLAYCNAFIINEKEEVEKQTFADIRNGYTQTAKWSNSYIKDGRGEIKENLLKYCTINNVSGVLFRKAALLNANPFDREFKYIGDWYSYLKICNLYKMAYLHEPLNFYRAHQNNSSKGLGKDVGFLSEYFKLFDWAIKHIDYVDRKEVEKCFAFYTRHSLRKNWCIRLKLYRQLRKINPYLFWLLLKHNTIAPFVERVKNLK